MFAYLTYVYLENCTLPARIATAAFVEFWGGTYEVSSTIAIGRRRSTAQLTLVSSNAWVRSHRSRADLRLVKA